MLCCEAGCPSALFRIFTATFRSAWSAVGELPTEGRDLPPGELPERGVVPPDAAGVPRVGCTVLAAVETLVRVLLRWVCRRGTVEHRPAVHRTAEPANLRPGAFTTALNDGALAPIPVGSGNQAAGFGAPSAAARVS